GEELPVRVAGIGHRAELVDLERQTLQARAFLREEHRTAHLGPDGNSGGDQQRCREAQPRSGGGNVDGSLEQSGGGEGHGFLGYASKDLFASWDTEWSMRSRSVRG